MAEPPALPKLPAWEALRHHYGTVRKLHLRGLFAEDPTRGERLVSEGAGLFLDYSKNLVTDETVRLLVSLAEQSGLRERTRAMFAGDHINVSEDRPALHVALRMPQGSKLIVDGVDVVGEVHAVLRSMADFVERVRSGAWTGHTGKPIRNVVNIGIGGSDLGPVMAYEALRSFSRRDMRFRFVSNVDGTDFVEATLDLDPAETLFIVSSKTFTTLETMTNARSAREWSLSTLGEPAAIAKHFVAVSTKRVKCGQVRDRVENMFGFWDWVGGRYSMDSAVGLSTMLAVGPEAISGDARGLSRHGRAFPRHALRSQSPGADRAASVWYRDFFGAQSIGVMPYEQYLKRFPAYLQQLAMESNGKHVTLHGRAVDYQTGAIYWGSRARTASTASTS